MKSILSASVCAAVLAFAVPALADTTTSTSTHHHMAKHHGMKGKKGMKGGKMSGDAAVQDLNAKSLAAARSGQPLDVGSSSSAPAPAPAAPATGTPASTMPSNAPGGQ